MAQVALRQVLTAIGDAAEATTADELIDAVLLATVSAVAADSALVTQMRSAGATVRSWPDDFLTINEQLAFERLHADEPWPLATNAQSGSGAPLRISDRFSQRQYRDLSIYQGLFRQIGFDHQVAFAIPMDATRRICVTLNRCGRDFSANDLDVIESLRRPLAASAARLAQREKLSVRAPHRASLSQRELDVIALVASGLTNDQVGRRLGISARTVNKHLEHIYAKTGLRNRTEAASRWHSPNLY